MIIVTKRVIFLHLFVPIAFIQALRNKILTIDIISDLVKDTFLTADGVIFVFILFSWIVSMVFLYIRVFNNLGGEQLEL